MSRPAGPVYCVDSPSFNPEQLIKDVERQKLALEWLNNRRSLYTASRILFQLPEKDTFTYHAIVSVSLSQAQGIMSLGGVNGLHAWYLDADFKNVGPPPQADVDAYVAVFNPSTVTASALKNLKTNAKRDSIRSKVAANLNDKRFLHPQLAKKLTIPKCKKLHIPNLYYDFWAWSCRELEWCGPWTEPERNPRSHHILPILMHHFGCATPSHESLEILKILADGREVADIGSGNGYWTFMLRQYGFTVHPVDNMQSEWRVNWVNDTTIADGVKWLGRNAGGKDMVLLLVYPVVGGGIGGGSEGGFTRDLVKAYQGDTLAVVGTQNGNGYTGFKSMTMDQFMEREQQDWTKVVQIPLPSFANKDEALYVFQRGDRAPYE